MTTEPPIVFDPSDTIVALATPRGGAPRGILRLSGPLAWDLLGDLFRPALTGPSEAFRPQAVVGQLTLPPLALPVPATLHLSRAPRSYTGQDLVEVHTLGSPPILELALSTFMARGARQALPGEFTMRAFLSGKLDLTAAEAVLGLIDARTSRQAEVALEQMAGGISRPIMRLRDQLLDLLAELEAGLDFAEEDLEFMDRSELRAVLEAASAQLQGIGQQMQGRTLGNDRRRAVLIGPPNVGKSSLFNALLGRDAALVSQSAGTTRDYLIGELRLADCSIELVDTAGIEQTVDAISRRAQTIRDSVVYDADLLLFCVDSSDSNSSANFPTELLNQANHTLVVITKCDLVRPRCYDHPIQAVATQTSPRKVEDHFPGTLNEYSVLRTQYSDTPTTAESPTSIGPPILVSSISGAGLPDLRAAIEAWIRGSHEDSTGVVAATAARCRQAIAGAETATARALEAIDSPAGDDLIAVEIRLALDELAQVVGAVFTDDILDRIFSRFCIGK